MADPLEHLKAALADRYTIERELGSGGMATVYLAQDLKHERQVAVKVLRPELAAALGPERFHQEIKIAANLTHPHILPLHDSGDAEGFLYYVMPRIEGESLGDKLAHEGELPIPEAVRILRDVVDALSHAHKHGVIHRDIKPDNVLLSERHALVTDFGVAKAVSEATGAHKLTTEGVALGTPAYMSPEQAAADKHIDHRADIYAVGALAYELLTGRPPFTGTTPQEVLSAHVTQAPEPVTKYRATVPPALAQVVMRCLEKKAADRWQTAEELLPQLEALATPSGGVTPTGTIPVDRVVKRRRMMVGGAVAAFVIVAMGVALLLPRWSREAFDPNRVLVVEFADEIGREETEALGRWAQDHIIHLLTDAGFAEVVDWRTAQAVSQNVAAARMEGGPGSILALADDARAGTVVSGSIYGEGDSIHIQSRITDANDGSTRGVVRPVVGSIGERSELVGRLGQQVVAALAPLFDHDLGSWEPRVRPATFGAYEAFSEGLDAYLEALDEEGMAEAARHFERAVAADPTFSRARLWAAQSYLVSEWASGERSNLAKVDSLVAPLLEFRGQLSRYDDCRLDFVMAIRPPRSTRAMHEAARCMAQAALGSDDAKKEVAVTAVMVNRPGEAVELLRELDPDRGLTRQWWEYWPLLGFAYHMLGEYEGELEAAWEWRQRFPQEGSPNRPPQGWLDSEARALAALDRLNDVAGVAEEMRSVAENLGNSLGVLALELRAHGHRDAAQELLDESITWCQSRLNDTEETRGHLATWLYQAERWDDAQRMYQDLAEEYPENTGYLAALGLLAARRGDREEALRISEQLRSFEDSWGQPAYTSDRARIAALLGDRQEAMTLLQQASDVFGWGAWVFWHRDIDFESMRDYPQFQELMKPKG